MRCGCENGGDCTSISVCAAEAMVEDAVEAREWQPIETAPKDGTPFITFCPDRDDDWEMMYDLAGWNEISQTWWKLNCGFDFATHWMPLPSALESGQSELSGPQGQAGE